MSSTVDYKKIRDFERAFKAGRDPLAQSYEGAIFKDSPEYLYGEEVHFEEAPIKASSEQKETLSSLSEFVKKEAKNGMLAFSGGTVAVTERTDNGGRLIRLDRPAPLKAGFISSILSCENCGDLVAKDAVKVTEWKENSGSPLVLFVNGFRATSDKSSSVVTGEEGELLDKMIGAMKLQPGEFSKSAAIKCSLSLVDSVIYEKLAKNCLSYLFDEIYLYKPKVVVTLGYVPTNYLLETQEKLMSIHGKVYRHKLLYADGSEFEFDHMPLFSLDFLVQRPELKGEAWKDLQKVMKMVGKL